MSEMQHTVFAHMYVLTTTDGAEHLCLEGNTDYEMCPVDEIEERRSEYEEMRQDEVEDFLTYAFNLRFFQTVCGVVVTAHITHARIEVRAREAVTDEERAACERNAEVAELNEIGDKVLNEAQEEEA